MSLRTQVDSSRTQVDFGLVRVLVVFVALLAGTSARAEERKVAIDAEIIGPKEVSLGRVRMTVAARSDEAAKGSFGSLTLTVSADVGPTFDKDCNLTTINAKLEDSDATGPNRKRETKMTIHACGSSSPPTTLPGTGANRVVVTIRPAP
jgi:hypothetical protein